MAKYSANAFQTEATGQLPFFLNSGQELKMDFDLDELPAPESINKRLQQAQARNVAERIKAI
jgi:hypothetical protein